MFGQTNFFIEHLIFWILFLATFGLFAGSILYHALIIRLGQPEDNKRLDSIGERVASLFTIVLGQRKLFKDPAAGIIHAFIFWGFCVHMFTTSEMIIRGLFDFEFSFGHTLADIWSGLNFVYYPILFFEEIFAFVVIAAILAALARHILLRPKRYSKKWSARADLYIILGFILVHMVLLSLTWAAEVSLDPNHYHGSWLARPFSMTVGLLFPDFNPVTGQGAGLIFSSRVLWWLHTVVLFSFIVYITPISSFVNRLGVSKHIHVIYAITNTFFHQLKSKTNKLKKLEINLEAEDVESFGVDKVEGFTWKNLMDHYACLNCGRCMDQCPAYNTGKKLNPRDLVWNIRTHLVEKGPILLAKKDKKLSEMKIEEMNEREKEQRAILDAKLIGDVVTPQEIWACTTCGACVEACPVMIEHINKIVDMRRYLALTEMSFPDGGDELMRSLENNSNPYGQGFAARFDWATGRKDIPLASEKKDADYLFYIGCAGSFDPRAIKVTLAICDILNAAGVSFAVLGTDEKCCGDTARKMGNEYLAQTLIEENIAKFKESGAKNILVHCPHGYNIIKKEYPDYGGKFNVIHTSELFQKLIRDNKIKLSPSTKGKFAYHDPCYLGRYNNMYSQPRNLMRKTGVSIVEHEKTKTTSFCCGGGGGWNFLEETEGKRINSERSEEMLKTGCEGVAVSCPFCLAMFEDGLKALPSGENIKVLDVAELIAQSLDKSPKPDAASSSESTGNTPPEKVDAKE